MELKREINLQVNIELEIVDTYQEHEQSYMDVVVKSDWLVHNETITIQITDEDYERFYDNEYVEDDLLYAYKDEIMEDVTLDVDYEVEGEIKYQLVD